LIRAQQIWFEIDEEELLSSIQDCVLQCHVSVLRVFFNKKIFMVGHIITLIQYAGHASTSFVRFDQYDVIFHLALQRSSCTPSSWFIHCRHKFI